MSDLQPKSNNTYGVGQTERLQWHRVEQDSHICECALYLYTYIPVHKGFEWLHSLQMSTIACNIADKIEDDRARKE